MNRSLFSSPIIFLLVVIFISEQGCSSSGSKVTLLRSGSKSITGELISIRKSCLLLDTLYVDWSDINSASKRSKAYQSIAKVLIAVESETGDSIHVERKDQILNGFLTGLGAVLIFIGIDGLSGSINHEQDGYKFIGAATLLLSGLITGSLLSDSELYLRIKNETDLDPLKRVARYEDNEPVEFKLLQPCTKKNP